MDRNETITTIRAALKRRSGKTWSVTGGTGTSWGWIRIDSPPARRLYAWDGITAKDPKYDGYSSAQEREELGQLLGLGKAVHPQGVSIAASHDYWREYIDRAEGRPPTKIAERYWD